MILSLLIDVKSIKVIFGFNLMIRMKKIARWRCGTKISKTNLKTIISPLLTRHRSARGVKKLERPNWRSLWWVRALKFSPNWIKFEKPSENKVSLTFFVQFWQLFTVSSILAESYRSNLLDSRFFDTTDTPESASIVEWNKFWSFRSMCNNS